MRKMYVRELQVPEDAMSEVATILLENEIENQITNADEEDELVTIEVRYEKDDKETIREVIDLIDNYDEGINDEQDDDEGDK